MTACPSAATLARLGLDPVRDETLSTLEGHIAACPDCQAALDRLMHNDAAASPLPSPTLPDREDWPKLPGFAIERELGRGSMSVVYLARQPSLARLVALKVLRSGPAAGSRDYVRWLREGRSFSLLRHENVVRLHDVGEAGGWLYLVLEYVPGGTLNDRLDVPYPAADAARLLADIAEAVEAIHRAGLLHLDLKPSNILMDAPPGAPRERAVPRVGDFGLAYLRDDPDATSNTITPAGPIGTPRYMAPEQIGAGRDRLGTAADVYGLGALLYHVMTGRPPFVAPSVAETLDQVRNQDPVPPRRLNPAIPRDLETICLKCLRKEPSHRYATAREVADDLRRFLGGEAIAARPASPAGRAWRWCRRRPPVAALAAALASALAGGFLGMFLLWQRSESLRCQAEWERSRAEVAQGRAEAAQRRAEAAQRRAEAEVDRASTLLGQLIELNAGAAGSLPRLIDPARKIDLLWQARRHLIDLADRLPDREAMYAHLRAVDERLGETLREESRMDEMRSLYESSLRDAEAAIRDFPRAGFAREWRYNLLHRLAELAETERRAADLLALLERSLAGAEEAYRDAPGPGTLTQVVMRRRLLARAVAGQGRRDEARDLLLANRRALEDPPPDWLTEAIAVDRVLDPIFARHLGFEPPPARCDGGAGPAAIGALSSPDAESLPADDWARRLARALRFDDPGCPATFRASRTAPSVSFWMRTIASDQRNRHRLDLAGRTADRLVAFARLLVASSPDDPASHLAMADALEQLGKNAWRVEDRATIELALRQAIAANRRAVDVAPYNEVARYNLERRQRKLDELLHPPPRSPAGPGASR